ncbi:hypothetical protein D3C80_1724010 [compost metagenome]
MTLLANDVECSSSSVLLQENDERPLRAFEERSEFGNSICYVFEEPATVQSKGIHVLPSSQEVTETLAWRVRGWPGYLPYLGAGRADRSEVGNSLCPADSHRHRDLQNRLRELAL